jgi:putative oxidoreductase
MSEAAIERSKWETQREAGRYLAPAGRALFSLIFILGGLGHFNPHTIAFAASQNVPIAGLLVPLSGLLALAGGLSILVGYRVKWGAALIVAFLVPVTFTMHRFWGLSDAAAAQMQMVQFMKNLGLAGGALLIAHFGAGPVSLDQRRA